MPQAIEWSFATPKISAFLPSSRPIRSSVALASAAEPTIGPVPRNRLDRPSRAPSPACARSCSMPTACSCTATQPIAGLARGARRAAAPRHPVPRRDELLVGAPVHRSPRRSARRRASTSTRAEIITAASAAAAYTASAPPGSAAPRARRAGRAAGVGRPGGRLTPDEADARGRAGRGRRHRRCGRRPLVSQPRHRVPAAPQRRRVRGDASQPVVDDAEGLHARCRRASSRASSSRSGGGP